LAAAFVYVTDALKMIYAERKEVWGVYGDENYCKTCIVGTFRENVFFFGKFFWGLLPTAKE
jgi:hypothetical protein